MARRWSIIGGIVFVAAAGLSIWLIVSHSRPEPTYQGKPLSFWLAGYDTATYDQEYPHGPPAPSREEAIEAIESMGPAAQEDLLQMLQQPRSKLAVRLATLTYRWRFHRFGHFRLNRPFQATYAFMALGPAASNAVPGLVKIFDHNPTPFIQQAVPALMGFIGAGAESAIPMLLRAASHTNERVRCNAIQSLSIIAKAPDQVVPVMTSLLSDTNVAVRCYAVQALGVYGTNARPAVPALLALWHSVSNTPAPVGFGRPTAFGTWLWVDWSTVSAGSSPDLRSTVAGAMQAIDPETAEREGIR